MASISLDRATGRRIIQFRGPDGRRRSIRLGKVSQKTAMAVKVKVEKLVAAVLSDHVPDDETLRWVGGLDDTMREKLAAVGLDERRSRSTLGAFIDDYKASRTDVKDSTRLVFTRVRGHLISHFGEDKPVRAITPGDADKWRLRLLDKGLAENTVRRSCGVAKQFFTAARRQHLISENPFTDLVAAVKANPERFHFLPIGDAEKILAACPDAEWRLLFALARFGGLRVPSEVLCLRWNDIDWDQDRFTVTSSKTEHHEGGGSRVVPIFPELKPYLIESFEQAEEGAEHCITRYRDPGVNLRSQLLKIIRRAGVEQWPKLWQNLRSTRETELADEFPAHVASAWIGNSVPVAVKHYLQVTDDHFNKAVQNPVQRFAAKSREEPREEGGEAQKTALRGSAQGNATQRENIEMQAMGDTGLEPVTSSV